MANWHSAFVLNEFIFGKYPTLDNIDLLNNLDIKLIINLSYKKYKSDIVTKINKLGITTINFSIKNANYPKSINDFVKLITLLVDYSKMNVKFYIHCRHGRGRSGLLAICYLIKKYNFDLSKAFDIINNCHRAGHGQKWQQRTIPTHQVQLEFLQIFNQNKS